MYENSYGNYDLLDLHRKQQEEEEKEELEKKEKDKNGTTRAENSQTQEEPHGKAKSAGDKISKAAGTKVAETKPVGENENIKEEPTDDGLPKHPRLHDLDAESLHKLLNEKQIKLDVLKKVTGQPVEQKGKKQEPELEFEDAPPDFIAIHSILEKYRNRKCAQRKLEKSYKKRYDEDLKVVLKAKLESIDYEIADDMLITRRQRRNKRKNPDGLNREDWTKHETTKARRLVEIFEQESTPAYFINIDKSLIISQLRERLGNPSGTNQGGTWLCGPSACTHLILNYDPYSYTQIMIDLFKYGHSKTFHSIRSSAEMSDIKADANGQVDKSGKPQRGEDPEYSTSMSVVDFILIGSIRRTANRQEGPIKNFKKYDPRRAFEIESGTFPWEIKDMLTNLYGFEIEKHGFYIFGENIMAIEKAVKEGKPVILFVDSTGLKRQGEKKDDYKDDGKFGILGIHYIVIDFSKEFKVTGDNIKFSYWDYGGSSTDIDITRKGFHTAVKGYWIIRPKHMQ